jgi:cytoplasmic iron level regulating protein YaaA (DUF328/UPF0246 family)
MAMSNITVKMESSTQSKIDFISTSNKRNKSDVIRLIIEYVLENPKILKDIKL